MASGGGRTASSLPRHLVLDASQLTVGDIIGHGANGVAHRGILNAEPVCVKFLHALRDRELYGVMPGSAEEAHVVKEFAAEIVMAASLHSEHIVAFRGAVMDGDSSIPSAIVFELAQGSLDAFLRDLKSPLTPSTFAWFCVDILLGLKYLHDQIPPVMHRDLKPANILVFQSVDGTGEQPRLKIGDVGLAKLTNPAASRHATHGVGTLFYMAPEVMEGDYDHRADMFSFGVMMAEIVVSQLCCPSRSSDAFESRQDMVDAAVSWLRDRIGNDALATLIERCGVVDAAGRLTASAALALARNWDGKHPTGASAPTPGPCVDVGLLIAAMEGDGLADELLATIAEAVDAQPAMQWPAVIDLMLSQGVNSTAVTRISAAYDALVAGTSPAETTAPCAAPGVSGSVTAKKKTRRGGKKRKKKAQATEGEGGGVETVPVPAVVSASPAVLAAAAAVREFATKAEHTSSDWRKLIDAFSSPESRADVDVACILLGAIGDAGATAAAVDAFVAPFLVEIASALPPVSAEHCQAFVHAVSALCFFPATHLALFSGKQTGFDLMLRCMEQHPTMSEIQDEGCSAITSMCSAGNPRVLPALAGSRVLKAVVTALQRCPTSLHVQLSGVNALNAFIQVDAQKVELIKQGVPVTLVAALSRFPDHSELLGSVAAMLAALAFGVTRRRMAVLMESGALAHIISVMPRHLDDATVPARCCLAIAEFAVDFPHRNALVTMQAAKSILPALQRHSTHNELLTFAFMTLCKLAGLPHCRGQLVEAGILPTLVTILTRNAGAAELVSSCCSVLGGLAEDPSYRAMVGSSGCLPMVVAAMKRHLADAKLHVDAIGFLARLCDDSHGRHELVKCGGVEALVGVMAAHPSVIDIQFNCCFALRRFTVDAECGARLIACGGLTHVLAAMSRHPDDVELHANALAILGQLSQSDATRPAILKSNATKVVLESVAAHVSSAGPVHYGVGLLANWADNAACCAVICLPKNIRTILAILGRYPDEDYVEESVFGVLLRVSETPDGVSALQSVSCLPTIARIMKRHPHAPLIQSYGRALILNLAA